MRKTGVPLGQSTAFIIASQLATTATKGKMLVICDSEEYTCRRRIKQKIDTVPFVEDPVINERGLSLLNNSRYIESAPFTLSEFEKKPPAKHLNSKCAMSDKKKKKKRRMCSKSRRQNRKRN
jgi:hypothetical protein